VNGRKDNEAPSLNGASVLDSSVDVAVIRASFSNIVVKSWCDESPVLRCLSGPRQNLPNSRLNAQYK
jgi:hypothetical protein